jgi:hypothetical protein
MNLMAKWNQLGESQLINEYERAQVREEFNQLCEKAMIATRAARKIDVRRLFAEEYGVSLLPPTLGWPREYQYLRVNA